MLVKVWSIDDVFVVECPLRKVVLFELLTDDAPIGVVVAAIDVLAVRNVFPGKSSAEDTRIAQAMSNIRFR